MSASMVKIDELKRQRPSAWSRLLAQNPATRGTVVTGVKKEQQLQMPSGERYLLQLAGYEEAAVLVGKNTNATEATFFADLSPHLSPMTPYCWLSHVAGDQSWVILDEVYNDWPMNKWTTFDVESIIDKLILLHSEFWERESHLTEFGLETRLSDSFPSNQTSFGMEEKQAFGTKALQPGAQDQRIDAERRAADLFISEHALNTAGKLAPIFQQAASGLQAIQMIGGWPGVLEQEHVVALSDLLDDPVPVLYPLRQAPSTLTHGDPAPKKWFISLFGETILVDWMDIKIGPGIYDLISFIEQFDIIETPDGTWRQRKNWPISEETIIDTYLLGMGQRLGNRFDARAVRDSIPAARCFYTIVNWLPRFNKWLDLDYVNKEVWADYANMSDQELTELGFGQMASLRPHLAGLFKRLLEAYHSL